jgi:hypothetical protein
VNLCEKDYQILENDFGAIEGPFVEKERGVADIQFFLWFFPTDGVAYPVGNIVQ